MVVKAVTKIIWNKDVPITTFVGIPMIYIIAGTIMKPPPTPIIAARMPTRIPITNGGIALIYKFDVRNRIFSGKRCTQVWRLIFLIF